MYKELTSIQSSWWHIDHQLYVIGLRSETPVGKGDSNGEHLGLEKLNMAEITKMLQLPPVEKYENLTMSRSNLTAK